jgi:hypothetical protein
MLVLAFVLVLQPALSSLPLLSIIFQGFGSMTSLSDGIARFRIFLISDVMACRAVHRAMLDHVSIFTKTGIVLWRKSMCKLKVAINFVLRSVPYSAHVFVCAFVLSFLGAHESMRSSALS